MTNQNEPERTQPQPRPQPPPRPAPPTRPEPPTRPGPPSRPEPPPREQSPSPRQDSASDDFAYVLASSLYPSSFKTYKQFRAWFEKKVPEQVVRRRKPSPQRLEIHAGDWHRLMAAFSEIGGGKIDIDSLADDKILEVIDKAKELRNEIRVQRGLPPEIIGEDPYYWER